MGGDQKPIGIPVDEVGLLRTSGIVIVPLENQRGDVVPVALTTAGAEWLEKENPQKLLRGYLERESRGRQNNEYVN